MSRRQTNPLSAGAGRWRALDPFVARERLFATRMARRPSTAFLYEFGRFGAKQAWACLFAGIILTLLLATHAFYPRDSPLSRYDFLFVAAAVTQFLLLRLGLGLVALFIWFAENIGTFSAVWLYPHQYAGWGMVHVAKLGSWFLLMLVRYSLVDSVQKPKKAVLF